MAVARHILSSLALLVALLLGLPGGVAAEDPGVGAPAARASTPVVHVFWQEGCPHCANAREALATMQQTAGGLVLDPIEVGTGGADDRLFLNLIQLLEIDRAGVPLVFIGRHHVVGFSAAHTPDQYRTLIGGCAEAPCPDLVAGMRHLLAVVEGRIVTDMTAPPLLA